MDVFKRINPDKEIPEGLFWSILYTVNVIVDD